MYNAETTGKPLTIGGGRNMGGLTAGDAMSYLKVVKDVFQDKKETYNTFLKLRRTNLELKCNALFLSSLPSFFQQHEMFVDLTLMAPSRIKEKTVCWFDQTPGFL